MILIDSDPAKRSLVEEQLDVGFVLGNGAHIPTLEAAEVDQCDLFVAASSSDQANLAASLRSPSFRTVGTEGSYLFSAPDDLSEFLPKP